MSLMIPSFLGLSGRIKKRLMSVVWARDGIGSSGGEDSSNLGCVPLQEALIISQSVMYRGVIKK